MGNNRKRRHHTVPLSYLSNFTTEDSQIAVARMDNQKIYNSSLINTSVVNGFYALSPERQDELQLKENIFEDWLSDEIETPAAVVFKKILNDKWPLSFEDRKIMAQFIIVQALRVPEQRDFIDQISSDIFVEELESLGKEGLEEKIIKHFGKEFSENNLERLWSNHLKGEIKVQHDSLTHLARILEFSNKYMPYVAGRKWCLVKFYDKHLITCDSPVVIEQPIHEKITIEGNNYILSGGAGIANSPVIYFPISRSVGLCLLEVSKYPKYTFEDMIEGVHDIYLPATEDLYNFFINGVLNNAHNQIFCHPDDVNLLPTPLPEQKRKIYMDGDAEKILNRIKRITKNDRA